MEKLRPREAIDVGSPFVLNASVYLGEAKGYPNREQVPDWASSWDVECPDYDPQYHVDPHVIESIGVWAEPEIDDPEVYAQLRKNPIGRTGIAGRGLLGRWEANYTVDGIVTRENRAGNIELLTITRGDNGAEALPGGFVDDHELSNKQSAARREVFEETGLVLPEQPDVTVAENYYVVSSRSTDDAWVETDAFHWHLSGDEALQELNASGDLSDATSAQWVEISQERMQKVLESHRYLIDAAMKNYLSL